MVQHTGVSAGRCLCHRSPKINNNLYRGLGIVQNSPISVQSPYFLKEGLKVYDYNPEKARELLKQAGFQYNAQNQLLDSDGNRVRFTLLTNSNNLIRVAIGAQVKQDLAKIGMQVDYTPINFNVLIDKTSTSRDWDAHIIGFTGGLNPMPPLISGCPAEPPIPLT